MQGNPDGDTSQSRCIPYGVPRCGANSPRYGISTVFSRASAIFSRPRRRRRNSRRPYCPETDRAVERRRRKQAVVAIQLDLLLHHLRISGVGPQASAAVNFCGTVALQTGMGWLGGKWKCFRAGSRDRQTFSYRVHHDLWDFDVASEPTLIEFRGKPAVAVTTKIV